MPSLAELAQRVSGTLTGDGSVQIARVAATGEADGASLTFATDERYLQEAMNSPAAAVMAPKALLDGARAYPKPLIAVEDVRLALAAALKVFERPVPRGAFCHPSAVVAESARIGAGVFIGANVCIGERVEVGSGTTIQANVVIADDARIGKDCLLNQNAAVLEACVLGDRVVVHSGAVIGSEGFGWAFDAGALQKIPQIGNVVLGDDVEIGSNTCVDRAQTGSTSIGDGSKIDNLCQIAHNCKIGKHVAIAAQCGMAGTTIIGDYVQIGGQVGFKGHITIGSRVIIAAGSAIWGDIPDDSFVSGRPARPHKEELRREVMVRKLPKLFSRVDELEKKSRNDA